MTRLRILPAAGARRTVAVAALALVLASGCALDAEREAQPDAGAEASIVTTVAEPSPSDPFAAVDEAFRRLALDRAEVEPSQPTRIWDRLVSRFEFPSCRDGDAADRWAHWYADNPEYMQRVFARAQPWLHDIANEVEARGLPGEYALLPVVESAFDPFAHSRESATGPWQFMHGTARDYGLPINDWYDGRRDFVAATSAALDYLSDLVAMFDGDLALALAAYNAGQGRVQRLMRRNRARGLGTEWHELALPRETRGYIPKLAGLGCLVRDPVRYAVRLPDM
ncbi:MAG: transglycosylase SLT domain-containing protein, partial [Wenzhouxiangellaceae bacterium]|nr:transglycosylase SLT domain-containing protein [Wenzhouxiangellaceae bacterium]